MISLNFLSCTRLLLVRQHAIRAHVTRSLVSCDVSLIAQSGCTVTRRRHHSTWPLPAHLSENLNVEHSQELTSDGSTGSGSRKHNRSTAQERDFDNVATGRGKLSPTISHLFKLILPLAPLSAHFQHPSVNPSCDPTPTVFLLHPSQPISHVSRLIAASFPGRSVSISFRSLSSTGQIFQWSDSTDVGDFLRDAARASEFSIRVSLPKESATAPDQLEEYTMVVDVPTFADRTRFLRRQLEGILTELRSMQGLKQHCDKEARKSAKRVAFGGLGMLIVYWGAVARLTFWDYGWDVMEPITYLSSLSTVILGYLWFLYQGREVSYSSVLDSSIMTRRHALYKQRGFDIDHWNALLAQERSLRAEIAQIAQDYDRRTIQEKEPVKDSDNGAHEDDK